MKYLKFLVVVVFLTVCAMSTIVGAQDRMLNCQKYNNTSPGGNLLWADVDAVEIRSHQNENGAQLWLHDDGRWDNQGGKFSLLFRSQEALRAYCSKPVPSPAELRVKAAAEPLCPSSVGKGQRWKSF